jgi:SAM-dependent methyltransferase
MPEPIPPGPWRARLKRVPGLAPAVRWARAEWQRFLGAAVDVRWRAKLAVWPRAQRTGRVAQVWGDDAATRFSRLPRGWTDSDPIMWAHVFPLFGGIDWYEYIRQRFCPEPRAAGLSLCCGAGYVERDFLRRGILAACEGIDISPSAIELARREAEAAGLSERLTYRVADLERASLDSGRYDVVIGWMALHHLRRLEHVFREVRKALRPGGIFVVNEYVGPSRFQFPRRQVARIDELLSELPVELRRTPDGSVKERYQAPRLQEVVGHDPSEAVRSHRLLPLLRKHFVLAECIGYGGTFLNGLLQGIVHNFDPQNEEHRHALERLYAAERDAIDSGEFPSDYAFVIAQRPQQR